MRTSFILAVVPLSAAISAMLVAIATHNNLVAILVNGLVWLFIGVGAGMWAYRKDHT
jgi:hypothetical protein